MFFDILGERGYCGHIVTGHIITSVEIRSVVFCVVEGRLTCRRTLDAGDDNHFVNTHAGNTLNPAPVSLSLLFSEESDTLRCAFFAPDNPREGDIIGKTMHGLVCGTARSSFF